MIDGSCRGGEKKGLDKQKGGGWREWSRDGWKLSVQHHHLSGVHTTRFLLTLPTHLTDVSLPHQASPNTIFHPFPSEITFLPLFLSVLHLFYRFVFSFFFAFVSSFFLYFPLFCFPLFIFFPN